MIFYLAYDKIIINLGKNVQNNSQNNQKSCDIMLYEKHRDYEEYFSSDVVETPAHFHRSIEIMYCQSGTRSFVLNGTEQILNAGELLIIPPLNTHSFDLDKDCVCRCNVLPSEYSDEWDKYVGNKEPSCFVISDNATVSDICEHLNKISPTINKFIRRGIYEYVLGKIFETVKFTESQKSKELNFTAKVLKYIDEQYFNDITLDELAKKFGYSKFYFSNLFNKHFNTNLKKYLNEVRISKAVRLLPQHDISEVCSLCGYNSLQAFFYNFKKITGKTPKQYNKE